MKQFYSILAATLFASAAIPSAQGAVQLSVDFFHDNLEAHGDWREVGDYGYCWQPRDVDRDWRPYRDGRWLYTDAGWTWDSDEPYSWAVYHYGRWARVDRIGWVWVPGTEWGPAWVSWRRSERHVGWAPLPPEATFTRSIGFNVRVDADFDIGPTNYSFVDVRDFGSRRLSRVIIAPQQNITIINRTTNITNITYVNNTVINNGPQYDVISRESAVPIRKLKLDRREDFEGDPRTMKADQLRTVVKGDSVRIAAPAFDTAPAKAPRKVVAKVEKAEVNHGWKDAGTTEEVAKLRTKIKEEPAQPKQEPTAAPVKEETKPVATPVPKAPVVAKEAPAKDENLVPDGKMPKGKTPKKEEPKAIATPVPKAPEVAKEATPKDEKPVPDGKMPKGKAPKKEEPKAEPKADAPPKPKPAVVARPVTPEEARPAAPAIEKEKTPLVVPSKKSKNNDTPVRTETKQREKVLPGRDTPPREPEKNIDTKREKAPLPLVEPKRVEKKPPVLKPEVDKAVRKSPDIRKEAPPTPQPAEPAGEPTKGKGKKKGKTDEDKAEPKN